MGDIRSFFGSSNAQRNPALDVSDDESDAKPSQAATCKRPLSLLQQAEEGKGERVQWSDDEEDAPAVTAKPTRKYKVKPDEGPKLLVVKSKGEVPGFCARPEYEGMEKIVFATHRDIKVGGDDTTTQTLKQRGGIDCEIGAEDDELGYDELEAVVAAARDIAKEICDGDGKVAVVVAYKNKGNHGAFLLGKLAWRFVGLRRAGLKARCKVGEPGKWLYSEPWSTISRMAASGDVADKLLTWYQKN